MLNVKNIRIPYNIYLRNSFPRNKEGIFDEINLRWVTKKDIVAWFRNNNFKILSSSYTDHRSFFLKNKILSKSLGSLLAPQFIILAEKF